MKKIKFLIFLLALSSCNKYLGTVDPDYTPINEVTEIFSDLDKNKFRAIADYISGMTDRFAIKLHKSKI